MASLTFKDNSGGNVPSPNIKSIIYEDAAQNKYTFGVDNATNVFNTFKYEPNGAAEIDYSATATKFMTGGAIATLLGIGTNVDAIKTKTDSIPADLSADLVTIKTQVGTDLISGIKAKTDKITDTLGADVTAIKAKTDKMPADLNAELIKLTTIGNAINGNGNVTEAAKAVLESSFKKAIKEAGEDGSEWLKNEIKEIVSQPSFEIPTDSSSPLSWDW
ncbi:jg24732 [Pararge aegeria aegeria]|uniref:Jg24732 protein n=1 Tax=Pararge aegeria aegeria TaxID=348720 RepID=A0A8S4QHZ9_9NEOP|nr:jg24732 [Pararge aegeria aegeria]